MAKAGPFIRFIHFINARLSPKQFIMLSAMVVGLISGLLAVSLKFLAHYIQEFTLDGISFEYIHAFFPLIGILLTMGFIDVWLKGDFDKGTYHVLYAIGKKSSKIKRSQTYAQVVTSAFTVGLGGSAGLESPIVQAGAAVGSTYSSGFPLDYRDRTLLLGCGAAAGIAAAFNAPIAGVLFALEVLLVNVSVSAFIPILIAGATGALCSKILLGEEIILSVHLQQHFNYHNVPFYIALGLVSGLFSVYYTRSYLTADHFFTRRIKNTFVRALVGGVLLAGLILLFPPLFGEGYTSIRALASLRPSALLQYSVLENVIQSQGALILFVLAITLLKVWATAMTIGCGGNGGNFAPALFVGAFMGFLFASAVNYLHLGFVPETNFSLVGMAGILSGVFHAPLTGIFLIAEVTGGYDLIIPLMIVSALSFTVSRTLNPHSLDSAKLAEIGHFHATDRDSHILTTLATSSLIEKDFLPVSSKAMLGDLVKVVAKSRRNLFPVLGENENLVGVIILDHVREIMFKTELYNTIQIKEIMQEPPDVLDVNEDMLSIMGKFDRTQAWNLPVVDAGRYVGFVSKASIFSEYRKKLRQTSIE